MWALTPALSEAMNAYLWHAAISQWLNATGNASRVLGEGVNMAYPHPIPLRSDERLPLAVGKWLRSMGNTSRFAEEGDRN